MSKDSSGARDIPAMPLTARRVGACYSPLQQCCDVSSRMYAVMSHDLRPCGAIRYVITPGSMAAMRRKPPLSFR